MRTTGWKDIAELIGIVAIVASLIFVGLQLQQTQQIAIGDAYHARAELLVQAHSMVLQPESLSNVYYKAWGGEPLDEFEAEQLWRYQQIWFAYYENNFFQYRAGLLSHDHWLGTRHGIKGDISTNPVFQERWSREREQLSKPFADLVDELIAEIDAERQK